MKPKAKIELQRVVYMPKDLKPGILYVSEQFGTAAHLCPCGCGAKIRTPLGPTDWSLQVTKQVPTLFPSIGNWQQTCQSHYWIKRGEIIWAEKWTAEQIAKGRSNEEDRRRAYYATVERRGRGIVRRVSAWLEGFFKK